MSMSRRDTLVLIIGAAFWAVGIYIKITYVRAGYTRVYKHLPWFWKVLGLGRLVNLIA